MPLPVVLNDEVRVEIQPSWLRCCTRIPSLVDVKASVETLYESLHSLCELLSLCRVYALSEFGERHSLWRQQGSILVCESVSVYVILHDVEVAHVQCTLHHVVELR